MTESLSNEFKEKAAISYNRWTLQDDSKIDYGYLSRTGGKGIQEANNGGFYLTTAINYTNGPAHMGHAYEAACSDVIVRFQRLLGDKPVFFCTGTDEHGQKIAQRAEDEGKEPIDICNTYATGFQVLNQRMRISNDTYVRTTSDRHKKLAKELWNRCAHDIYLDKYNGWYNVREEAFVTDNEAKLTDYKDPVSGLPLKQVEEASYFFKMSKYQQQLVDHIRNNPKFIRPEQHRNYILNRLVSEELRDLSISRTTFSWGIPVPEGFESQHVMYVWLDALSNYLTGVDALGTTDGLENPLRKFWPANVHVIGKDILWFHTVIWPCLLLSAGLPLPEGVFAHGFVNDKDGKKMSKSLGNVVDPHDMLEKFPVDTFRWYLCKEAPFGGELSFNEDSLRDMHNSDLCDTLGNLVHRATTLSAKFCDGVVPDVPLPEKAPVDFVKVIDSYTSAMENLELQKGAQVAIAAFRDLNGYLQEEAPWLKKGDEFTTERQVVMRAVLEAVYIVAHLLLPFLPEGGHAIFERLSTPPVALKDLGRDGRNLVPGTKIVHGQVLYPKAKSEDELAKEGESKNKKESFEEAQKRKKADKAKQIAASKKGAVEAAGDAIQPDFTKMEIKVGKIVKVWNHPSADTLYCEEIDVGEGEPREIASGLRNHYSLEEMQDRLVLVVCNLRPVKLVGFRSNGMVLAAKSEDGKVELVAPPVDAQVGEVVTVEGATGLPMSATQVAKKKIWETVSVDLKTIEGGVATWQGKPIQTSTGVCMVASLVDAPIS